MSKLSMQKSIFATVLFMTCASAQADQCQLIPVAQASKALNHIKPESQYVAFCEPCGDKNFHKKEVQTVDDLKVKKDNFDQQTYWEISLNNKSIDLAYTFVRTADGSFLNLSKLADCPSEGVSAGFAAPEKTEEPVGD